jgi:hypothetical protein
LYTTEKRNRRTRPIAKKYFSFTGFAVVEMIVHDRYWGIGKKEKGKRKKVNSEW